MEVSVIGSPINEADVLNRYGCKTREQLNSKMESLWLEHRRVKFPFALESIEFSGTITETLQHVLHAMDVVQVEEDWEKNLMLTVANLRESGEGPTQQVSFAFNGDTYHNFHQEKYYEWGVDVPGARYAPLGLGYFSNLWMSMYFGNYEDFCDIVATMNPEQLSQALNTREGYHQVSAIFVPIMGMRQQDLGLRMLSFNPTQLDEFLREYPTRRCQHLQIFKKLISLGAKLDDRDRNGKTALFHSQPLVNTPLFREIITMARMLLEGGVDPNVRDNFGNCILGVAIEHRCDKLVDLLIQYNADPYTKDRLIEYVLETMIETAVRTKNVDCVRALMKAPRKEITRSTGRCSNCFNRMDMTLYKPATRKCSGCKLAWYCSKDCQAKDWASHKVVCRVVNKLNANHPRAE